MEDLKATGIVKAIGVSDFNITQLEQTLEVAKQPIELHQVEWNPKDHDEDMLKFCKAKNIQLQAWSPLGGSKGSLIPKSRPLLQRTTCPQLRSHYVGPCREMSQW